MVFLLFKLIFIGVQSLYSVAFISIVQQNESTVYTHTPPFGLLSIQVTTAHWVASPCCTVGSQIYFIHSSIYVSIQSPNSSHPPYFSLGIHIFALYIGVFNCALQIRSCMPFFSGFHMYKAGWFINRKKLSQDYSS